MSHDDWRCDRCGITWNQNTGAQRPAEAATKSKDDPTKG